MVASDSSCLTTTKASSTCFADEISGLRLPSRAGEGATSEASFDCAVASSVNRIALVNPVIRHAIKQVFSRGYFNCISPLRVVQISPNAIASHARAYAHAQRSLRICVPSII